MWCKSKPDIYVKTAEEEFKRLLCEKIAETDPIWSGDSFEIKKLFENERFLKIIVEISGWYFLLIKLFSKTIILNQVTFFILK